MTLWFDPWTSGMLASYNANCFPLVSRLLKLVKIVESRDCTAVLPTWYTEVGLSKAVASHHAQVSVKRLVGGSTSIYTSTSGLTSNTETSAVWWSAWNMKNVVFWDVTLCGFVRADVSEECIGSFIRVERISELGTTLAVTVTSYKLLYVANVVPSSLILSI
jgi:hypothetical protein